MTGERLWAHDGYKGVRAKLDAAKPYVETYLTYGNGQVFLVNQNPYHRVGWSIRKGEVEG